MKTEIQNQFKKSISVLIRFRYSHSGGTDLERSFLTNITVNARIKLTIIIVMAVGMKNSGLKYTGISDSMYVVGMLGIAGEPAGGRYSSNKKSLI